MPRHLLRAVSLLALFAGTLGVAAPAALAVDTPFSVRFAQTVRGSINAVGNQLLTCPAAAAGCTAARNRTGPEATMNNNYNMGYVDVDGDAATFNSSTSTLSLPAGATVVWAGLYWGADTQLGSGGASAAPNAGNRGSVRFKVGSSGYQTVTAAPADVLTSTGKPTRYRAFANVTSLLPAAGNGTYTVANVQTGRGDDRFAGWSLVVAYQDPTEGFHRVSVYDGLGTVDADHDFSTDIFPFYTPEDGSVATKTGLLAFEGDAGIIGETATFNGTPLTDAINGLGNLMNSTVARDGTLFTAKDPNYANLQGTDIDVWNNTGLLGNHQSTATLAFASNQDLFVPSALWLVSDEGPASNTAGPTIGGLERDGATLTASPGTWEGTPTITYEYQWQRCDAAGANCIDIPGETGTTYTLTPADVGSTVRVVVTAVNDAGSSTPSASAPSATITQLAPSNVTLPQLTGSHQDGETLTTTIGDWDGTAPLDYDVQWLRCDASGANCTDIPGATAPSYVLTGADIGSTVRSEVTASNDAGSDIAVSGPTSAVDPAPPVNTTVPTVGGVERDGETLTASDGVWTGTDPIVFTYQWERCDADGDDCQPIVGADEETYTLEDADAGQTVRVVVTGTNAVGADVATSEPTITVDGNPPANVVDPTLSGTTLDGDTLTLDDGDWTGTDTLTAAYRWERCDAAGCAPIAGATGLSYTLQAADVDGTVRAVVTYTNDYGSVSEATAPSAVVDATPPVLTVDPSVLGPAVDGETVTADPGVWAGTTPVTFEYQWLRCELDGTDCDEIAGATDVDYTVTGEDAGHGIRVEVTATNAGGSDDGVSPVAAVSAAAPQNTTLPSVDGDRVDGETLTADPGTWSGTAPVTFEYQWLRCEANGTDCVAIPGETGSEYTLTGDDVGHDVRVTVEASNAAADDVPATSAPFGGGGVALAPPVSVNPPVMSGLAEEGATLAATTGGWTGTEPIVMTYQWLRCDADGASCSAIDGATNSTYTLTPADIGGSVRVEVTGTNTAGDDVGTSAHSDEVETAPPVSTTPPSVTGSPIDGQTLTAVPGAFSGVGPLDLDYQWQRCEADGSACVDIPDAKDATYDLVSDDVGRAIVVVVTATNAGGSDSATSAATDEVLALAPVNTDVPTITGEPLDGETLTANPGTWTGTPTITYVYQWQRCDETGANCVDILGADDPTYTLVPGDIDHVLTVVVTATNGGGSVPSASAPTDTAEAAPPVNTDVPTITGTLEDGETLTAVDGTWTGTPTITYAYQWQRCNAAGADCLDIAGETDSTYTLTADDVGHAVLVEVTAGNDGGTGVATSVPSSGVAVDPPATSGTPTATGTPVDGETLVAEPGTWTGTGPIDFTYQWQRCDEAGIICADIAGATDAAYTLGSDDIGSTVIVLVTGDNGDQTTVASLLVGPVAALPPISTSPPTVSGSVGFGDTLTAGDGEWDGSRPLDFTYQWQRCDALGAGCLDIAGETDSTYTLTADDVGHTIRVEITATNVADDESAVSAPTDAALPAPPVNATQPPPPTGTVVDGGTLTAETGAWTGDGTITYTYQWQRCADDGTACTDIDGATEETYSPAAADVGHA
ncbi:MAG TPA: DUF3344 domain-containing protein, partial [Solirubrobacteraceae bacterium]|nr:DUF3344 domain-containing protein [Solirubrobacteraceae bacterium]